MNIFNPLNDTDTVLSRVVLKHIIVSFEFFKSHFNSVKNHHFYTFIYLNWRIFKEHFSQFEELL